MLDWRKLLSIMCFAALTLLSVGLVSCELNQTLQEQALSLYKARNNPEHSVGQLVPKLLQWVDEDGSIEAHGLLSICYFYGIGTEQNHELASTHAVLGKPSPNAAFIRAKLSHLQLATETPIDQKETIRLYREAVALGSSEAANNLAIILKDLGKTSNKDIQSLLELGVERFDLMALSNLAIYFRIQNDISKAMKLLPKAFLDDTFRTISPQIEAKTRWYTAAKYLEIYLDPKETSVAADNHSEVHAALVYIDRFLDEISSENDYWDFDAKTKHNAAADYLIALTEILQEAEKRGEKDLKTLLELWERFAKQHYTLLDPNDCYTLFNKMADIEYQQEMWTRVAILSNSLVQRMEESAEQQRDPELMFQVGVVCAWIYSSDSKAFTWFLRAAEAGHVGGMWNAYRGYRYGRGIVKNSALALEWLHRSAEAGSFQGKRALGILLMDGELEIESDSTAGALLLQEVADSGLKGDLPWKASLDLAERLPTSFLDHNQKDVIAMYRQAYRLKLNETASGSDETYKPEELPDVKGDALYIAGLLALYLMETQEAHPRTAADILGIRITDDVQQMTAKSIIHLEKEEYESARSLLQQIALTNDAEAFFQLSLLYAFGKSVEIDQDLSHRYLIAAAKAGSSEAGLYIANHNIYRRLIQIDEIFGSSHPSLLTIRFEAELKEKEFYEWLQSYDTFGDELNQLSFLPILSTVFSRGSTNDETITLRNAARELEKEEILFTSGTYKNSLLLGYENGRTVSIRRRSDMIEASLTLPVTTDDKLLLRINEIINTPDSGTSGTVTGQKDKCLVKIRIDQTSHVQSEIKDKLALLAAISLRVIELQQAHKDSYMRTEKDD